MSNPGESNTTLIENKGQLVDSLARGCKPQEAWRIGTEHEKFGFRRPDRARGKLKPFAPPAYEPEGIEALLSSLEGPDWQAIRDDGHLIGLKGAGAHKGRSISLEPAGQFELSGAPVRTVQETEQEMIAHFRQIGGPARELGLGFAPLGFQPLWPRDAMPWMPKSRYAIMRRYMPQVGRRGLDMMTRTCTVQVNLDFSSEADMARKMRVSLALQPLITALMANSPFAEGRPTGRLSNRAYIWLDTDNQRSGQPSLFFEDGFGFERYVDWALDVPMYFINRDGRNVDVAGCSFRKWLDGVKQEPLAGFRPTIGDFEDHLTTLFPDVRLKQFLEMRGADAGRPDMMVAQSAFWAGLLYDGDVLAEAERVVKAQPWLQYQSLAELVVEQAMDAPFPGGLRQLAKRILELAERGLQKRNFGEEYYLAPLYEIADGAQTQAERWLDRYKGIWKEDVRHVFQEADISL